MENKTIFQVGDRVYDVISSEYGEVVDLQDRVKVKINRQGEEFVYYLVDGRMWEHEIPRLIFAHQVNNVVIPKPQRPFDLKEFLKSFKTNKSMSINGDAIRFDRKTNKYMYYNREFIATTEIGYEEEDANIICEKLNEHKVDPNDYTQAIIELIKEGVM